MNAITVKLFPRLISKWFVVSVLSVCTGGALQAAVLSVRSNNAPSLSVPLSMQSTIVSCSFNA